MNRRPALFLDRDGIVNVEKNYLHCKEDVEFVSGIFELVRAANNAGYLVVIVTNQAGIGRGYYSEADFRALTSWMDAQFLAQGARIDKTYFCPHHPIYGLGEYRCECESRKPAPGMLQRAAAELCIELSASIMIGDRVTDMLAAKAAGVPLRMLLAHNERPLEHADGACVIASLADALELLEGYLSRAVQQN